VHVLTSAGDRTINTGNGFFAQAYQPLIGTNPPKPDAPPPLRPDVPCETQEAPDLRSIPGPPDTEVARGLPDTAEARERYDEARSRALDWVEGMLEDAGLDRAWRVAR
jgi:phospholipid/cholesterol/gamma-HCH transport system substrate-binding protein